jgi:hypothetical protein
MSSGALKGIEVVLIAGLVGWFAYSQLRALKQDAPKGTTSKDAPPDPASAEAPESTVEDPSRKGS